METQIVFRCGQYNLEGLLCRVPGDHGVIVAHPHPQYGGDMYNPVVEAVCKVAVAQGHTSLRFNFRGVGGSDGVHGGGIAERQDVLSGVEFLLKSGVNQILLVGYSFGAYVIAGIDDAESQGGRVFIAPPVGLMDFSSVEMGGGLRAVVTAENDDFAPRAILDQYLDKWPVGDIHRVKEADHFFTGQQKELSVILAQLFPRVE